MSTHTSALHTNEHKQKIKENSKKFLNILKNWKINFVNSPGNSKTQMESSQVITLRDLWLGLIFVLSFLDAKNTKAVALNWDLGGWGWERMTVGSSTASTPVP